MCMCRATNVGYIITILHNLINVHDGHMPSMLINHEITILQKEWSSIKISSPLKAPMEGDLGCITCGSEDMVQGERGHICVQWLNWVHCNMFHLVGSDAPYSNGGHSIVEEIEVRQIVNSHNWIHLWCDCHTPTLHKAFHYRLLHLGPRYITNSQ